MRPAAFKQHSIGHNSRPGRPPVTYAIAFDLDTKVLQELYPNASWQNASFDVERGLKKFGFERRQGSVYFGNDDVDAVTCVLAVQDLTSAYAWFRPSVTDVRMLRIDDNNDLKPAIERVQLGK
jgi:virulence-associated protein VapD